MSILDHIGLIQKIVWSYMNTNAKYGSIGGLDFDDLFSEACITYLETIHLYDPSKGKESTFIWTVLSNHLNDLVRKEYEKINKEYVIEPNAMVNLEEKKKWGKRRGNEEEEINIDTKNENEWTIGPEQKLIAKEQWDEILNKLSPEAVAICNIVMDEKDVYLPINKPKFCRGIIFKLLRQRGWSWGSIWKTFTEIKTAIAI